MVTSIPLLQHILYIYMHNQLQLESTSMRQEIRMQIDCINKWLKAKERNKNSKMHVSVGEFANKKNYITTHKR